MKLNKKQIHLFEADKLNQLTIEIYEAMQSKHEDKYALDNQETSLQLIQEFVNEAKEFGFEGEIQLKKYVELVYGFEIMQERPFNETIQKLLEMEVIDQFEKLILIEHFLYKSSLEMEEE